MAIYHFSGNIISRGKAQSATAAAAYRSGDTLYSERYGKYNQYHREVKAESFILKPEHAPEWTLDRQTLWNEVEKVEKQHNAQLAREFNVALPVELPQDIQLELTKEFVQENFVNEGMVADVSIHRDDPNNPHFHVMLTTRPFKENGEWSDTKTRKVYLKDDEGNYLYTNKGNKRSRREHIKGWDTKDKLLEWRKNWADITNEYLKRNGLDIRISEKSNADLGLETKPTIHEGYKAREMGDKSDRVNYNKEVKKYNDNLIKLDEYKKEIKQVKEVEKLTRHFSPKDKKQLSNVAKKLNVFVNFDSVINKQIQLSHWEKSELFKSEFNREDSSSIVEINNQKEAVSIANEILIKEANKFIDNHYKGYLSNNEILSDYQKMYITDLSVKENKILSKDEFIDAVYVSSNKEFYDSIKSITRDAFKSHLDLSKKLNTYEDDLKKLVEKYDVDFKDKSSVDKLDKKQLNELRLATVRVQNTKTAMKFVEDYFNNKIDEMYPDISNKLHKKMSIHEKEIVVSSFDYYGRVLTPKEIRNLKDNPPNKYSIEVKKKVLEKMNEYNNSHVSNKTYWKEAKDKLRKQSSITMEIKKQFPEIFGENATPAMEQFFYSELASMSDESKDIVRLYIKDESPQDDDLTNYYVMTDYRKVGGMNNLLSSGFSAINRTFNEMDYAEKDKIAEMDRLQRKISNRNKRRNSGLNR